MLRRRSRAGVRDSPSAAPARRSSPPPARRCTAAMVSAPCRATRRSRSSASSAPCSGWPLVKALLARIVGVAQVVGAGQRREGAAVVDDAAHRDAAEADAVIAALAPDQPGAGALADRPLVGQRDLQRGVDRFRARAGEEHPVELPPLGAGGDLGELLGEFEGDGVAHLEGRGEVHRRELALDRGRDPAAAVAGIAAPQARRAVEHRAAVIGGVVHARRGHEHPRRRLELAVGRERHPEGVHRLRVAQGHWRTSRGLGVDAGTGNRFGLRGKDRRCTSRTAAGTCLARRLPRTSPASHVACLARGLAGWGRPDRRRRGSGDGRHQPHRRDRPAGAAGRNAPVHPRRPSRRGLVAGAITEDRPLRPDPVPRGPPPAGGSRRPRGSRAGGRGTTFPG